MLDTELERSVCAYGQLEDDAATLTQGALRHDLTLMGLNQSPGDGKPLAAAPGCPGTGWVYPVEPLE